MKPITHMLNEAQAKELFAENAVMLGDRDVVFIYKAAELFGPDVMAWAESCMKYQGYIDVKEWGSWTCSDDGSVYYFHLSGFKKLVYQHNVMLAAKEHAASEGGKIWDELWAARIAKLDAENAEDARKREERKAKRAAARKAKQEAAARAAQEAAGQAAGA